MMSNETTKRRTRIDYCYSPFASSRYAVESDFQAAINGILINAGIPYRSECQLSKFYATYDFHIGDSVVCECKVDMRTHQAATCIGQLVRYRSEHDGPIILLIPDDLHIWHHDEPLLKTLCEIVREGELIEWLRSRNLCGDPSKVHPVLQRLQGRMENVFLSRYARRS